MKIQSFKILNGKAFVAQIFILILVLVVIGESVYLYTDYRNDEVREQNNSGMDNYSSEPIQSERKEIFTTQTVTPQPSVKVSSIKVLSPNGGEQLVSGSIHQIKWNYPNATSTSKVDLYLVDPGSSYYPCVRTASSCTPSFRADLDKNIFANTTYSWIVGTDIVNNSIRPGYYLMQICIAGTNDCDVSNKTFEITSLNSSPRIEPSALPNSPVTSYYSQELEVIGFSTSTVTWQIVGGSLPQGLYLEKQGLTCTSSYPPICPRPETIMFKALIVGMPTKAGNYNFTVKASNGTQSVTKTYSLNLY